MLEIEYEEGIVLVLKQQYSGVMNGLLGIPEAVRTKLLFKEY